MVVGVGKANDPYFTDDGLNKTAHDYPEIVQVSQSILRQNSNLSKIIKGGSIVAKKKEIDSGVLICPPSRSKYVPILYAYKSVGKKV